ncbi:LuxR C-terminal-related transcriptional regulator [Labedaea rhizosphaerae]|uniref:Regulatory LuxR family protein n=1 Tax=Labedaea rhizosphaerae TaxID=598644 RepID=A0A4R6RT65_LABRH|nr:LuxR C-terminal-related transcriptional regulator [Labedaea rhizosphaerae]TDP90020.1 regulatory LuxR family protein [Labedaea rhizosphaerae]
MSLRDIGFDDLEERVYRALLADPERDLSALAAVVGTGADQVRTALKGLVELEVARPDQPTPSSYGLISPAAALGRLVERTEAALLRKHREVGDTRAEIAELATRAARRPAASTAETGIDRLESVDDVRTALEELAFFNRTSVFAVQADGPMHADALAASKPLDLRALRRGMDMRVIYHEVVREDRLVLAYIRELTAAGARFRVSAQPLERMIVMDEQVAVVPIDPKDSAKGALVIRQPALLTSLVRLFHSLWADAAEITLPDEVVPAPRTTTELDEQDRQILTLLAEGNTDDAIARVVGISARHLRRKIQSMMSRLGAVSRFEAGVEATRRGWI